MKPNCHVSHTPIDRFHATNLPLPPNPSQNPSSRRRPAPPAARNGRRRRAPAIRSPDFPAPRRCPRVLPQCAPAARAPPVVAVVAGARRARRGVRVGAGAVPSGAGPELLDHRARRPWQVDAGRPAAGAHRHHPEGPWAAPVPRQAASATLILPAHSPSCSIS